MVIEFTATCSRSSRGASQPRLPCGGGAADDNPRLGQRDRQPFASSSVHTRAGVPDARDDQFYHSATTLGRCTTFYHDSLSKDVVGDARMVGTIAERRHCAGGFAAVRFAIVSLSPACHQSRSSDFARLAWFPRCGCSALDVRRQLRDRSRRRAVTYIRRDERRYTATQSRSQFDHTTSEIH